MSRKFRTYARPSRNRPMLNIRVSRYVHRWPSVDSHARLDIYGKKQIYMRIYEYNIMNHCFNTALTYRIGLSRICVKAEWKFDKMSQR